MHHVLPGYQNKKIDAFYPARPPAPGDVWNHRDYGTWREHIWELIADYADADVRSEFLAHPPEYVVCDDLSWLDDIVGTVHDIEVDSKALLAHRLRQRYRALRAVHGTSITDLKPFYREGLRPLVPEQYHNLAREIFLAGDFPELSEDDLQAAIAAVRSDLRAGRVYFEANEEMLIEHAGHYMLYGSEYLLGIAAHLGGSRDYRRVLKARGVPTMFICDVPLNFIGEDTLREFAGEALECIFQELLDGHKFVRDRWRGAGFSIRQPLPPECLIGHYHPVIRRDPIGAC